MINQTNISFKSYDGSSISAFLASPESYKSAVIVIHEIFGITEYIRNVARRLASLGYLAVAPNLYSRRSDVLNESNIASVMRMFWSIPPERRSDPNAIKELINSLSPTERIIAEELVLNRESTEERMVKDIEATFNYIKETYKPIKLGVIGFCMGGGLAFESLTRLPFDAGVIYYGRAPRNLDAIANIKAAVLAIYAGNDPGINQGVPSLIEAVFKHGLRFEMVIYPGTRHAFATEGGPAYNEEAAKDAWERTVNFFKKHLG
ncbi:dienelactone hydrolase family protein [Caldivirga maquilingensis]|uniref:Carboxymethylenebutenolidase n=1 Tax=Caldivirga maquilingensis (strain ATCC 700844 / DSM 13496 / JCM 10307 / IC-167) TaxID=397948 RepID=A8M996_CALMQ|nr:dienelactone hydrolase family protein [Caldivirga maquilingensis]ABW02315.1 Carboxymethylenebutenolidase [Caldivirga maquilingensis IC-167]